MEEPFAIQKTEHSNLFLQHKLQQSKHPVLQGVSWHSDICFLHTLVLPGLDSILFT